MNRFHLLTILLLSVISAASAAANLTSIDAVGASVTLTSDDDIQRVKHFVLKAPLRLVVDLYGVKPGNVRPPNALSNGFSRLRVGELTDRTRFVFDAAGTELPAFDVDQGKRRVSVTWRGTSASTADRPQSVAARIVDIEILSGSVVGDPGEAASASRVVQGRHEARISVIPYAGMGRIRHFVLEAPGRLVVDLGGVVPGAHSTSIGLPGGFNRLRIGRKPDRTRLVFDQSGNRLPRFEVFEQPAEGTIVVAWGGRGGDATTDTVPAASAGAVSGVQSRTAPAASPVALSPRGEVAGDDTARSTFVFDDAEAKIVLQRIAEAGNQQIEVSDQVSGRLTMRLVDVPWEQALGMVLEVAGLRADKQGDVLRIVPLAP